MSETNFDTQAIIDKYLIKMVTLFETMQLGQGPPVFFPGICCRGVLHPSADNNREENCVVHKGLYDIYI